MLKTTLKRICVQ